MCEQCKDRFLFTVYNTTIVEDALLKFKKEQGNYLLPNGFEVVEDPLYGGVPIEQYLESVHNRFFDEISSNERNSNRIYIYRTELLTRTNSLVVICMADRKRFTCPSLRYMPGRRF